MKEKILNIQSKYVLRDYLNPESEYKMLEEVWQEAQKEAQKEIFGELKELVYQRLRINGDWRK